jgi:hypothetical protein
MERDKRPKRVISSLLGLTVGQLGATAPSAVIDLASTNLDCLVGVDVTKSAAVSCLDVNGATAPLVQAAHATVAAFPPPTITATASGSAGWQRTPVTVTLTASDGTGPGIRSITYSATDAQATPETTVLGSTTQVVVSSDGTTTISYWATDNAGTPSDGRHHFGSGNCNNSNR